MTKLRTTLHYAVRELMVEDDRLGSSLGVVIDDCEVTVTLPLTPKEEELATSAAPAPVFDERFPSREAMPPVHAGQDVFVVLSSSPVEPSPTQPVAIDMLRVEVLTEAPLSASEYDGERGGAHQDVWDRANAVMEKAGKAGDLVIERLLAWSRVRYNQTWLGLDGEAPERVGSEELVDLDAGRRLPWPARSDMSVMVIERDSAWNERLMRELEQLVHASSPPAAEALLADARLLAGAKGPPDPPRALLIAAVACEVKIKTTLQTLATPAQEPFVQLLLENPRDWTLAASALVNKPLDIVAGASLKDADKELYKRIIKLFERRNAFAHKGKTPTEAEARDGVQASRLLFAWLDTLEPARASAAG